MTRAFRLLLWPTVATAICVAILVFLGTWQLERLAWKDELLQRINARIHAPAEPLPPEAAWLAFSAEKDEYRRVSLSGRYLFDKQALVRANVSRDRGSIVAGFVVLTPMRLADGAIVIVNRGFIAEPMAGPLRELDQRTPPDASITGLMRAPQERGAFVPPDDPAKGEWFTRDIGAIAAAGHLTRVAPFIVDADLPPGWSEGPRGGMTIVSFPNNHLEYALTWYGLAIGLLGVFVVFSWRRLRAQGT